MPLQLRPGASALRLFLGLFVVGGLTWASGAPQHGKKAVDALRRHGSYDGLRKAYDAARYNVQESSDAPFRKARNRAQGLEVEFGPREIKLDHQQGAIRMRLAAYGYGKQLQIPQAALPVAEGNRVEYRRAELTEWYVNEARGLEQGFTLRQPPAGRQIGNPLVLALETGGGLIPELEPGGDAVTLRAAAQPVLRYSGLKSWDARGQVIPSRMEVVGRQVRLLVDDSGAQYPLTVDPVFVQQTKLMAYDGAAEDIFGDGVALSGDTAMIGADGDDEYRGSVYVFVRSGTVWNLHQKLTAAVRQQDAGFGWPLALSGDTAVIAAGGEDGYRGAAYIFVRNGTNWTQQDRLTALDGQAQDYFGSAVALSGATALVGAGEAAGGRGAAYAFVRGGPGWTQQQKLTTAEAEGIGYFGWAVAVNGNTALIGAGDNNNRRGAAYVFVRSGTGWNQQAKLTAPDGEEGDALGWSVALSGETALIGADGDDGRRGSAFVFVRNGATWNLQQKLTALDGVSGDAFGYPLDLKGDSAIVGAPNASLDRGSAYIFRRNGTVWTQQGKLTASDGVERDIFGISVALDGDTYLIGAYLKSNGQNNNQGAAYVFTGVLNDEPADATVIGSFPFRSTQSTRFATSNALNDPPHPCAAGSPNFNTVWFGFLASFTGKMVASTAGSNYGTVLTAYVGSSRGTQLACNDRLVGTNQSRIEFNVVAGQSYLIEVSSYDSNGGTLVLTVDKADTRIGIIRGNAWYVDGNGNGAFDNGIDKTFDWSGGPGSTYVNGDWNGDGKSKAGFFKNGLWYLDDNGNGVYEPGTDKLYGFGWSDPCVAPVTGDWNGDGRTKVGVFCNGFWYLDYNGNGVWDGSTIDRLYGWGWNGVTPLVGDWNGDKRSKIGYFVNGLFYLDYNGNGVWEPATDKQYGWGWNGVVPLVGDWSGSGTTKIGFFINGLWYLDYNGNGVWEPATDKVYNLGWSGVTPLVGDWSADGRTKIGMFTNGFWYLDFNGDGVWSGSPIDRSYQLGQAGDLPAIGRW